MPYSLNAAGELVFVDEVPDRVTPAAKPASDSTLRPELEQRDPGAAPERTVQLVDPTGGVFDVGESGVQTALESGRYRVASPEEVQRWDTRAQREGAVATLEAFGNAAHRGLWNTTAAPFELLQRGLEAAGVEGGPAREKDAFEQLRDEEQRRLAEDNPTATLAGNIVGSLPAAAIYGGAAGAGARALGASPLAAGTAAGVAEGASEGYSAASEQAFFENRELTSEQMLAAMGLGALVGGGVSYGVGKATDRLFSRAGSRGATPLDSPYLPKTGGVADDVVEGGAKPFGERFADTLRGYSEERVAKAIGARGSDIRKLGKTSEKAEAEMRRMARDVLEGELDDGTPIFRAVQSQDDLVGNLVRAREEAGAKLGAFRDKVATYVDDAAPELRPKPATIADRIEREVLQELDRSKLTASEASKVRIAADEIRELGDSVSLPELKRYQEILKRKVYPKPTGPGLPAMVPEGAAELQKVERILEETIEATTDKAAAKMSGGAELGLYKELKAKFRSYREAAQIAGKADLQDLGNRVASPTDYGAGAVGAVLGGIVSGNPVGAAIAGAAVGSAHKVLREHSSAVLAVLADRLAKTVDRKVTKGLDRFFERQLGAAAHALPANTNARAASPLTRVSARTGKPTTAAVAAAAGLTTPMALFLGKEKDKQTAYRKRAKEILDAQAEFGTRIRSRVEETLGGLAPEAPKLAASMTTKATKAVQFLGSKLPAPIKDARSLTPSRARHVSDVDIERFAKYWAAASNPLSVLEDLRVGRLAAEQVEALQVVYPELYQTIRLKVVQRLGELDQKGAFVPFRTRLQLDLLLGLSGAGEPTVSAPMVALFQQLRETTPTPEQGDQPAPPAKPVNIASHLRSGRDAMDPGAQQL